MLDFVNSCCLRSEPADGGDDGWTPDGARFVTAPLGSYGAPLRVHAAPGSLTEPLTPIAITNQSPGVSALSENPPGNLVRPGARAAATGAGGLRHILLSKGVVPYERACLTLQVRNGVHWALSGSVHTRSMKRATHRDTHRTTHSSAHSGKFPELFSSQTSQPTSQEASQETSQLQVRGHFLRVAKLPALPAPWATAAVMYHGGIPARVQVSP